ncbi:MAG: hypothetical protein ACE5F9_08680, partial [Phycisphaerae bacterium]
PGSDKRAGHAQHMQTGYYVTMTTQDPPPFRPDSAVAFVVLRHSERSGTHFDLMIDAGERLATWRYLTEPFGAAADGMSCEEIGRHRRVYLDYEGPISGDRGHVTRSDGGLCEVHSRRDDRWDVTFGGQRLRGRFLIERIEQEGRRWRLRAAR